MLDDFLDDGLDVKIQGLSGLVFISSSTREEQKGR